MAGLSTGCARVGHFVSARTPETVQRRETGAKSVPIGCPGFSSPGHSAPGDAKIAPNALPITQRPAPASSDDA